MRGQFVFVGETDEADAYEIKYTFTESKMDKCVVGWGKVSNNVISLVTSKGKPAAATATRTSPANGGTTGPVSILGTKAG